MDEKNNNINNQNVNNPMDNNMNANPNMNNQDNPYYNPYFQGGDATSPYFDVNNANPGFNNNMYKNDSDQNNNVNNNNIPENNQENTNANSDSLNLFGLDEQNQNPNIPDNNLNDSYNNNYNNYDMNNSNDNNMMYNQNLGQFDNNSNFVDNTQVNPNMGMNIDNNENNMNMNTDFNNQNYEYNNNQYQGQMQDNFYGSDNDDTFRRTWMGNLYDKANTKKFNVAAFFFTGYYFFYRKMFLFGILFTILAVVLPLISNILCGFVFYPLYKSHINKQLNKYKANSQSPGSLIDIAKRKGGTSVLAVFIALIILFVIPVIILLVVIPTVFASFIANLFSGFASGNNVNNEVQNNNTTVQEPIDDEYDYYNFYNDYVFDYNSSNWQEDIQNESLVYGNYSLKFVQALENLSSYNFDITMQEGRSNFFTYLYNQFSSQINTTTTLELGNSSFVAANTDLTIYYSYLDLIYQDTSSMERCYFILIPGDDIFIEFILSNNDTVIPEDIHEEVLDYLSNIYIFEEDEEIEDELQNVLGNSVNDTIGNGITSDVVNDVGTNNVNNSNTANNVNNTVSGTNVVDWNAISAPNNYVFLD